MKNIPLTANQYYSNAGGGGLNPLNSRSPFNQNKRTPVKFAVDSLDLLLINQFPEQSKNENQRKSKEHKNNWMKFTPGFESIYRDTYAVPGHSTSHQNNGKKSDKVELHAKQFIQTAYRVGNEKFKRYHEKQIISSILHNNHHSSTSTNPISSNLNQNNANLPAAGNGSRPNPDGSLNTNPSSNPFSISYLLMNSMFIHACRVPFFIFHFSLSERQIFDILQKFLRAYSNYLQSLHILPIELSLPPPHSHSVFYFYKQISGLFFLLFKFYLLDFFNILNQFRWNNNNRNKY